MAATETSGLFTRADGAASKWVMAAVVEASCSIANASGVAKCLMAECCPSACSPCPLSPMCARLLGLIKHVEGLLHDRGILLTTTGRKLGLQWRKTKSSCADHLHIRIGRDQDFFGPKLSSSFNDIRLEEPLHHYTNPIWGVSRLGDSNFLSIFVVALLSIAGI